MRSLLTKIIFTLSFAAVAVTLHAGGAHAYTNSRLMDDGVFDNVGTMNEAQIQAFLVSKNSVCLQNYTDVDPSWNGSAWSYSGSVSAAHVIYKSAQMWGINPQVILATLQKEESLITGTDCAAWRYNSAMGYGCPDAGGCNPKYAGFTRQVLWGSWQLMFNRQRSEGHTGWDDDGSINYVGFMTEGTFSSGPCCAAVYHNGISVIDGQSIHMDTGATASLYTYTPHLGQSFPGIFESWFGPTWGNGASIQTTSCKTQANVYRFWSRRFNNTHFFTSSTTERDALLIDGNWNFEGVGFCAVTSPQGGYVPVYRYWSPGFGNTHFFTASDAEKVALASDRHWNYEGIAFYVPTSTAVDASAITINRYWSPKFNNDHFFTGSDAEKGALAGDRNWAFEGVGWLAEMPTPD